MRLKILGHSRDQIFERNPQDSTLPSVALLGLRISRILVPVDFSESSRKALQYAVAFAQQFGAEILLLHVLEPAPPQIEIMEAVLTDTTFREEATLELSQWQREAVSLSRAVKAVVRNGTAPDQEIVRAAEEDDIDLIIMGNHGRMGLARVFIGSTAEKVVRRAPCPVLVIRLREHDFVARGDAKPR